MQASSQVRSIGGYVLAGGRSTRMGRDKALLEFGGKPLVQHAVLKLRRLTGEAYILSGRPELAAFAPLVPDLRESCGPLGGMEAALAHTQRDWILVLPVDMPFLPTTLLEDWIRGVVNQPAARVAIFNVDGAPQPALCLLHRSLLPPVRRSVDEGRLKLYPALEAAAAELSAGSSAPLDDVLLSRRWESEAMPDQLPLTKAQRAARHLWFANLNTPQEFAEAERHVDALDT
jgi:molybdopterin-guanine dinucleotide biosynthesis protein A